MTCAPGDMICPGAIDPNGCPTADTCMPSKGPVGLDGNDCPVHCPAACPVDHMHCGGNMDANGCMMPDTCVPMEGPLGTDGTPCPGVCPTVCPAHAGFMTCPG